MKLEKLITVSAHNFEATLPWAYALPPMRLLQVVNEVEPARQFMGWTECFRELLDPALLHKLDELDLLELGDVVSQWAEKSVALRNSIYDGDKK